MNKKNDRLRVLIIDHFLPENTYTLELARKLKKYCRLTMLCSNKYAAAEDSIDWVPSLYTGGRGKLGALRAYFKALLTTSRMLLSGNYDVVHVQSFKSDKLEIPLYLKLRRRCTRLVHTVHNALPHEERADDYIRYKRFYDACDRLIVHNEVSKTCLMETFDIPAEKISVIAHGTFSLNAEAAGVHKESPDDGITRFLQFGLIRKYKGIDILLEAISMIPKDIRANMQFVIAGNQHPKLDNTDYAAMAAALGIEDSLIFDIAYIPDKKLAEYFAQADFSSFPYRSIYGSGALLMSYTFETPVIVSDIPAFIEETADGSTGILFNTESPKALAEALMAAQRTDKAQREQYRRAIKELVTEKYNWEISAARTAELYMEEKM